MKYKGKQVNYYLFECDGKELEMFDKLDRCSYRGIAIDSEFNVSLTFSKVPYKDIQTAVSMMQILIEEGEV